MPSVDLGYLGRLILLNYLGEPHLAAQECGDVQHCHHLVSRMEPGTAGHALHAPLGWHGRNAGLLQRKHGQIGR